MTVTDKESPLVNRLSLLEMALLQMPAAVPRYTPKMCVGKKNTCFFFSFL